MTAWLTRSYASSIWSAGWSAGALLIALPVSIPIAVLLTALLVPDAAVLAHLVDTVLPTYLSNTLLLMVGVALISTTIGVVAAWLTTQYRFCGSTWLIPALVLPLAAPAYVVGYVYAELLEFAGPVQSFFRSALAIPGQTMTLPPIRSLPGAALVIALVLYPYIFLLARTSFLRQSVALHLPARALGASDAQLFWRVALPVARPAVAGGLALVLMETLADFGVVEHFGVPTLTSGIFRTWLAMGERAAAVHLAGWLFMLAVLLVVAEQISRRGEHVNPVSSAQPVQPKRLRGQASLYAFTACFLPVLFGFLVPMGYLAYLAWMNSEFFSTADFLPLIVNSTSVAGMAAACCVIAAICLAYAQRLSTSWIVRWGVRLATLGYAIPGMVLAVALLAPLSRLDQMLASMLRDVFNLQTGLLLTGTVVVLIFVYVARFLTVAFNSIQSGFLQIHDRFDEAARSLGANNSAVLRRVHVPMLYPSVITAALLVFVDVIKELPATLVLRPFNFETLATHVYRLAADERLAEAAGSALMLSVVGLLSIVPVLMTRKQGN